MCSLLCTVPLIAVSLCNVCEWRIVGELFQAVVPVCMALCHVVLRLCRIRNVLFSFCPEHSSLVLQCRGVPCNAVCLRSSVCSVFTLMYTDRNACSCPVLRFVLHLNVAVRISSTVRCFKCTKVEHNISETEYFISHISRLQDTQHYSPLRRIFPQSVDQSSPGISQHN